MEDSQPSVHSRRSERATSEQTVSTVVFDENPPQETNQTYFVDELIEIPNLGEVFISENNISDIRIY